MRCVRFERGLLLFLSGILTGSCAYSPEHGTTGQPRVIPSPAGRGSAQPRLFAAGPGEVVLSWLEKGNGTHALRFSRFQGEGWTDPGTVAVSSDWFVNWADFPSVVIRSEHEMVAHWLSRSGESPYAYDVKLSFSSDGGENWSGPVSPHSDGTRTEHGFVSIVPWGDGYAVVWLDGRNTQPDSSGESGAMTLRQAFFSSGGRQIEEHLLDSSVCDCCQTAMASTSEGLIVAYRDRSGEEVRDISFVIYRDGIWSPPRTAAEDGWVIPGCPVNGPALAVREDRIALAWFTSPENKSQVRVAFSDDLGASFSEPLPVDSGSPIGRVDVALDAHQDAWVSWIEVEPEPRLLVRQFSTNGLTGEPVEVAAVSSHRSTGFPQMVLTVSGLLFAWTESGKASEVRTATLDLR